MNKANKSQKTDNKTAKIAGILVLLAVVILVILLLLRGCGSKGTELPAQPETGTGISYDSAAVVGGWDEADMDKIVEGLNEQVEAGMINISMNTSPVFSDGTSEGNLMIVNEGVNRYPQIVEITRNDTGETIYKSGAIPVGSKIEKAKLSADLDAGTYDAASAKALDGGVLDDTGQLLSAAALTVCKLHNIGDAAPIRLAPLELLNGLQEANELLLGAGEQITGVEATSTADSLPDLPQLEQGYPMPDPTVDFAQMYQFGYTDGNTMLPLSKERARELFLQDVPIFVLNSDNTEYMVLDTEDLGAHSGIFGVERTEWESVRDTLQPRRDIVAPKQPDTLSYLHDDTAKTQPENYLKNAEMALEDNYGMIDGIINNAPKQTVEEQEERSSILAKLKAPVEATNRTEKHAPKRSAEKEL